MLGFTVSLDDGSVQIVEASGHTVGDKGELVLVADGELVLALPPGRWALVDELGTRLAAEWPPPNLAAVLDSLAHVLVAKYGHVVWSRCEESTFASGVFNEVDSLAGAVLALHQVDPESTDTSDLAMIADIRQRTAEAFNCHVPQGRLVPSARVTAFHCPRCGDLLHDEPKGLRCPTGDMRLSAKLTEAIQKYRQSSPELGADAGSSVDWGGTWFCPDDGFRMDAAPGQLPGCVSCQRVLPSGSLYQLIEFHVHS